MFWGLLAAVLSAMAAFTIGGRFAYGFTDPKIILITIGVVAAWYWRSGRAKNPAVVRAAIAYGVSYLPALALSKDHAMSLFGYPGQYSGSVLTTGLCASGAVLADRLSNSQKKHLRRTILAISVIVSILCVAQHFRMDPMRWPLFGGRPVGLYGTPTDTGAILVAALSVSLNPIIAMGIWASGLKAAWSGALICLLPIKFRVWGFVVAVVCGMTCCLISSDVASQDRTKIWSLAVRKSTVTGSGPATFAILDKNNVAGKKTTHAHSAILEALSTRGLPGVLGLFGILAFPQMAGFWVVCAFHRISFESVFIACVLAGIGKKEDCYA